MYAVSSLCKYLVNYGYAEVNPCRQVVLAKKARRMPAVLTVEEARWVLKAADDSRCPWMGFRNRAIVAVLLFCGLRRQELADVKITDIDLKSRWLKVRKGKGGKGRSIPLAPDAAEAIKDWLEFRPEVDHEYLLTGLGGRRLEKNGVARVFRGVAKRAGVERRGPGLNPGVARSLGPVHDGDLPAHGRGASAGGGGEAPARGCWNADGSGRRMSAGGGTPGARVAIRACAGRAGG